MIQYGSVGQNGTKLRKKKKKTNIKKLGTLATSELYQTRNTLLGKSVETVSAESLCYRMEKLSVQREIFH